MDSDLRKFLTVIDAIIRLGVTVCCLYSFDYFDGVANYMMYACCGSFQIMIIIVIICYSSRENEDISFIFFALIGFLLANQKRNNDSIEIMCICYILYIFNFLIPFNIVLFAYASQEIFVIMVHVISLVTGIYGYIILFLYSNDNNNATLPTKDGSKCLLLVDFTAKLSFAVLITMYTLLYMGKYRIFAGVIVGAYQAILMIGIVIFKDRKNDLLLVFIIPFGNISYLCCSNFVPKPAIFANLSFIIIFIAPLMAIFIIDAVFYSANNLLYGIIGTGVFSSLTSIAYLIDLFNEMRDIMDRGSRVVNRT